MGYVLVISLSYVCSIHNCDMTNDDAKNDTTLNSRRISRKKDIVGLYEYWNSYDYVFILFVSGKK